MCGWWCCAVRDVPTYVRQGAADIGVSGKDVLLEYDGADLYEPLDLGIARCRLMTAGLKDKPLPRARIRVATKFVNIAKQHFAARGVQADIIKLYGAMELAPLMDLADLIVDIVDTGNTLRANGMEPLELIAEISSRLVVNKAAMKTKHARVQSVIEQFARRASQSAARVEVHTNRPRIDHCTPPRLRVVPILTRQLGDLLAWDSVSDVRVHDGRRR